MDDFLRRLAPLMLLGVVACGASSTAPSSGLAGAWRTAPVPSGSGIDFSLATAGQSVRGTGHEFNLQYLADDLTVSGEARPDGSFRLSVAYGNGGFATYGGHLVGSDRLEGTWVGRVSAGSPLVFYRQVQ